MFFGAVRCAVSDFGALFVNLCALPYFLPMADIALSGSHKSVVSSITSVLENSWRDKVFLTQDIDSAHEQVIAYAANLLEASGVLATWFFTRDTPLRARLRSNPDLELGIHSNFNFLPNVDDRASREMRRMCWNGCWPSCLKPDACAASTPPRAPACSSCSGAAA